MGTERRVDVDDVPMALGQFRQGGAQRGGVDQIILRVEEDSTGRQADDLVIAVAIGARLSVLPGVFRGDDGDLMAKRGQRLGKGPDRSRNAIDAREIDIRQHEHVHAGQRIARPRQ